MLLAAAPQGCGARVVVYTGAVHRGSACVFWIWVKLWVVVVGVACCLAGGLDGVGVAPAAYFSWQDALKFGWRCWLRLVGLSADALELGAASSERRLVWCLVAASGGAPGWGTPRGGAGHRFGRTVSRRLYSGTAQSPYPTLRFQPVPPVVYLLLFVH